MLFKKKKRLNELKETWGKSIDKFRNMNLIPAFHDVFKENGSNYVDDKTWSDLNMDDVFIEMDRNISCIGQQYLYYLLHKYENDDNKLKQRNETIEYLKSNSNVREKIQLCLYYLRDDNSYFIPYVMSGDSLPFTKYYYVFYILSFLSVLSIVLIFINGVFLFSTIGILLFNIILDKLLSGKIYKYFSGFSGLNSLLISANLISRVKTDKKIEDIEVLKSKRSLLKKVKKKMGFIIYDKSSLPELLAMAIEYLNLFFLYDIIAYYRSVNLLYKNLNEIRIIYETVGRIDSYISTASYLSSLQYYSKPALENNKQISFKKMYHPLIEDAVPNSVNSINGSCLITGSNMSGKTTFIKTLGINIILAQTFNFCFAESFNSPKYCIKSAIRREENLSQGKSYFFVEIEAIQKFIEISEEHDKYLFLIDEIFRGTNTIERLASSSAVLNHLCMNNKVMVTTHDIELQFMLEGKYQMYHFSEQVEDGRFFFDYSIQEGSCKSGNAIKLLEIKNYPKDIVQNANNIVKALHKFEGGNEEMYKNISDIFEN